MFDGQVKQGTTLSFSASNEQKYTVSWTFKMQVHGENSSTKFFFFLNYTRKALPSHTLSFCGVQQEPGVCGAEEEEFILRISILTTVMSPTASLLEHPSKQSSFT